MQELNNYRAKCSLLFHYDWISIPLVYTQVHSGAGRKSVCKTKWWFVYLRFEIQSQFERNKSKIHQKLGLINTFFLCAGGHYSSLLVFCLLRDWPTISEPWEGVQRPQNRHVRPCFHPAAVLFLRWLAQGKTARSCLALKKTWKHNFICTL